MEHWHIISRSYRLLGGQVGFVGLSKVFFCLSVLGFFYTPFIMKVVVVVVVGVVAVVLVVVVMVAAAVVVMVGMVMVGMVMSVIRVAVINRIFYIFE